MATACSQSPLRGNHPAQLRSRSDHTFGIWLFYSVSLKTVAGQYSLEGSSFGAFTREGGDSGVELSSGKGKEWKFALTAGSLREAADCLSSRLAGVGEAGAGALACANERTTNVRSNVKRTITFPCTGGCWFCYFLQ